MIITSVVLSLLAFSSYADIVLARFGGPGYVPVVGDYDGDSKADIMVYNESSGLWCGMMSASGYELASICFGGAGYRAIQ